MPDLPLLRHRVAPVLVLFTSAALHGVAMISFAASSGVLKGMHHFSDTLYGTLFIGPVAMAIMGSMLGGTWARSVGLKPMLAASLTTATLALAGLGVMAAVPTPLAIPVAVAATLLMGLGYGLAAAPLNTYPGLLTPAHASNTLVAMHTCFAGGLALGPAMVSVLISHGQWPLFPQLATLAGLVLLVLCLVVPFPSPANHSPEAHQPDIHWLADPSHPARQRLFWGFVLMAFLYAMSEGTFSNWAVLYLSDNKHYPMPMATLALSLFWASLAATRLLVAILLNWVSARHLWQGLPLFIVLALLLIPLTQTVPTTLAGYVLAGVGCSAVFPLTMELCIERFASHTPWAASVVTAALMAGVGVATFALGPLQHLAPLDTLIQGSVVFPLAMMALAWQLNQNPHQTPTT
ncbi:MAG: MFS transporter [Cyanobacteria bacterium HKST-UBA05]|nr:MFS transporter [Cyanobacteria bacterium HKST-UBA05]